MILKVEREHENVKVLAITTVDGITDVLNATKNTYRILDGLNRTDVSIFFEFWILFFALSVSAVTV